MANVAEVILEQLRLWGVKRIYGVVGDAIFGLMDAIAKQDAIRFVSVKHESVAALMAAAEANCTGNLGVCTAQMGPGLANLINGLGAAYLDGHPVLAITGQAPLNKIGTHYKQYINQQQLVRAVAGYTELVVHPDAVPDSLSRAIQTSMTGETVAHLSIPADVFTMSTQSHPAEPIRGFEEFAGPEQQQALEIMKMAERPMLLLGSRARHAAEEIEQLAHVWGCGIALGYGATGVLPDRSPFLLGGLGEGGNPYLTSRFKEADAVLAVGTSWWPEGHTPNRDCRVIHVENRRMRLGNSGIPADCGIAGEIVQIIAHLVEGLKHHQTGAGWARQIQQCKQTWALQNDKDGNAPDFPLHPSRVMRAIEKCAAPDAVIALDEGDATLWFLRNFRAARQQVLLSGMWRTMGFGLPAAMAAKCGQPEKQVLCVTGDGGLAMVLADLLTAARYRLGITIILLNNGTLQMERNKMTAKGYVPEGTDIANPDFVKLALACGWDAKRVGSGEELEQFLQAAHFNTKPMLLDVPTAQIPYPDYENV